MSNPPDSHAKDFFASPALSLSLAGIFRNAESPTATAAGGSDVKAEDDSSVAGGRGDDTVEMSSENSGPARSRSDDDFLGGSDRNNEDDDEDAGEGEKKRRKKYHRHTAEQIREMEALFKESPHPDEKQRQHLSRQLGLSSRQVKFWFQNRRTQIKAIQERHENSLLKSEIEKLRDENRTMREALQAGCCPKCGDRVQEEKHLLVENARLRAEVDKLRSVIGNHPSLGSSPTTSSCSEENAREKKTSSEFYTGVFGLEKSRVMELVDQATTELRTMAGAGEPLWIRSVETGREILNYDEYMREFRHVGRDQIRPKVTIEASRDSGTVFVDLPRLVQSFMDVNKWKEMFPSIVSKASIVDVIRTGDGATSDGMVQLMFAEIQMLTPMVPAREVYFLRYCKQLSADQWTIADVSIDEIHDNSIDSSLMKCRKRPSGCVIDDKSNGHCKVTWVEHSQCQRISIDSMYRTIVNSGQAFGARRWLATLRWQCEQLVFFMATNVPTKDSAGVNTLAGRKSILNLAQRMTSSFCREIGASSHHTWTKILSKTGDDIRLCSRKTLNDPGEPPGLILCAASSVWVPVPPDVLFDFLRDAVHRGEWDAFSNGGAIQTIAQLSKGQHRGNAVSIQKTQRNDKTWILQDSSTNAYESVIASATIDIPELQSVMSGCNSNSIAVLSSGFSILPDGMESAPLVITSKQEKSTDGSLLTVAFQIQANPSPAAKLTAETVDSATALISCTLRNIRRRFQCDDG